MEERRQMLILPVEQQEKMEIHWILEWIFSIEDFVCRVIIR